MVSHQQIVLGEILTFLFLFPDNSKTEEAEDQVLAKTKTVMPLAQWIFSVRQGC